MLSIPHAVYLFAVATALALLECQIEGKHGWAAKLPCWRPQNQDSPISAIYSLCMEGRPLTGYHIAFFGMALIFLHYPFLEAVRWNLVLELKTISMFCLIMLFEDFLWFLWNPCYGIKKFNAQCIGWHKRWIGPIPSGYFILITLSFLFVLLAAPFEGGNIIKNWGITLGIFLGLTLASYLMSLRIIKSPLNP